MLDNLNFAFRFAADRSLLNLDTKYSGVLALVDNIA
jgi:hypothetical protein